ncbi:hypothetical protein CULT_2010007 [[Clostridium] ultunense Esp]|nr:hypothetical protein CULT_2010007 [[Clostridium] ultunense Esp]
MFPLGEASPDRLSFKAEVMIMGRVEKTGVISSKEADEVLRVNELK